MLMHMLTAIVFLLILTVAVVIHELAHYWNAKSVGLDVRAFSVGMGPVLFRKKWRGTEWRLSALPLGGYVDIPGMAAEIGEDGKPRTATTGFATKNVWEKIWVLVGGVIANYILAILLFATVTTIDPFYRYITTGIEPSSSGTIFAQITEGSVAESLGLQANDVVLSLNGTNQPDLDFVSNAIRTGDQLTLSVQRGEEVIDISTAWPIEGALANPNTGSERFLGVAMMPEITNTPDKINFLQAMSESIRFTIRVIPEAVSGLFEAIFKTLTFQEQSEGVAGPVGMVTMTNQATKGGLLPVLLMAALINFSLAIFNLLPIPALDGGRILMSIVIAIRGKPLPPGREEFIHFIGFALLITFMVLVTFNELSDLFTGAG